MFVPHKNKWNWTKSLDATYFTVWFNDCYGIVNDIFMTPLNVATFFCNLFFKSDNVMVRNRGRKWVEKAENIKIKTFNRHLQIPDLEKETG